MKSPQTGFSGRGREQILYKVELRARPKSIQLNISDLCYAAYTSSERAGYWPKA